MVLFSGRNAGSSWRNFERIKYLRAFLQTIEIKLMELKKDPTGNREELVQEKSYQKLYKKKSENLKEKPSTQNSESK